MLKNILISLIISLSFATVCFSGQTLVVSGTNNEEKQFDKFDLSKNFKINEITTETYWNAQLNSFRGVLITDILKSLDVPLTGDDVTITVIAHNDYAVAIPVKELIEHEPLLAFEMNNQQLPDGYGPFWIVSQLDSSKKGLSMGYWVWAVAKINYEF